MDYQAIIFNIQRFCIHDGPGIRTVVFFKGCNLHCPWCHNPESLRTAPELMHYPDRCLGCGRCARACRHGARVLQGGSVAWRDSLCKHCFTCADACPAEALVRCGKSMDVRAVYDEAVKDRSFYETSGGGVTASGGEPLLVPVFLRALFQRLKAAGVATAVETSACVAWPVIEPLLSCTDLFLVDLKSGDRAKLKAVTGADLALITGNLRRLLAGGRRVIVRIPVVPGWNDSAEDLAALAGVLEDLPGGCSAELLKYHRMAQGKYRALGTAGTSFDDVPEEESEAAFRAALAFFRGRNLHLLNES